MLKVPPYSLEAEQSVLWSLLIDKDGFIIVWDLLTQEDFYDDSNAKIYEIMFELFRVNKPIDLITVREKLDDKKLLDSIGGVWYLAELTEIVPSSTNVFEYAQIVKNKAVLRRLIKAWNEVAALGYMEDDIINELLEKAEKSLFNVTQTFIKNKLVHINDILTQRFEEFAEIHENPDLIKDHRLQTDYKNLDDKLTGLKWGDMVIVAARPSKLETPKMRARR